MERKSGSSSSSTNAAGRSGEAVMEAIARSTNSYIQLQFSGSQGEYFSVKVTLGDVSVIENFVI